MRNRLDRPGRRPCGPMLAVFVCLILLPACVNAANSGIDHESGNAPSRHTVWTDIYEQNKDSIINIYIGSQGGAGFILTKSGYAVSNAHVVLVPGEKSLTFWDGQTYPFHIVAVDPVQDIALVKIDADRTFNPVKLGTSADVMICEPVMAMGNPFGLGLTATIGTVSALGRSLASGGAAAYLDMIQVDLSMNPGNSGGLLVNILGDAIGMTSASKPDASNLNFVIPIDKILANLPDIISASGGYEFVLGMKVQGSGPAAVTEVTQGSPAAAAGLQVGDIITEIDGTPTPRGLDFTLALTGRNGGDELAVKFVRGQEPDQTTIALGKLPARPAEKVEGLAPGVNYEYYTGQWNILPNFDAIEPVNKGVSTGFSLGPAQGTDFFAVRFTGYVEAPAEGSYSFYTNSDDGSQLYIGDRLVVDNNGLHGASEKSGRIVLEAGLHAITVTFFEASGGESLSVSYQGPETDKQEIPPSVLFHKQ